MLQIPRAVFSTHDNSSTHSAGVPALVVVAQDTDVRKIEAGVLTSLKDGHVATQLAHTEITQGQAVQLWAITSEEAEEIPSTDYRHYSVTIDAEWVVASGNSLEEAIPDMALAITDFSVVANGRAGFVTVTLLASNADDTTFLRKNR